jgi:CRISPR/Cas system-associated exonuclease Cas4 (RecB family)
MIDHLSVSQVKTYLLCPLKYFYRYIAQLLAPPSSELTLGRSVHSALETNFRQKVTSQTDLPLSHVTDAFSDAWEQEVKETIFDDGEKPGQIKDEGIKILGVYHPTVSPTIQPKAVEQPFELSFANVPYTFKGKIDLEDVHGRIIDHKTTKRAPTPEQVKQDLQLTAYSMAHQVTQGRPEASLRLDVAVRTKVPKIMHLETHRTPTDHTRFLKLLGYVAKGIQSGLFYPNPGFTCPSCPYRQQCSAWQDA